ncbi:Crp/Fnr family transcriptional regulator [Alteromonadaceae bacterium M269]|nr:Crp/Fnr family transcriptional regulator [Alteromonadaceae bacterium M269]
MQLRVEALAMQMKISALIQDIFLTQTSVRELPKKYCLLRQGDTSQHAYFVKSGCLRMWYNDHGDDITVKFFTSGDVVSSLESFYQEIPSIFGIEAVIPSTVMSVDKATFKKYATESSAFNQEMLAVAVACMADYQNLFLNRIMKSPEDRFQLLMELNPELFDIVPHHYIASYLGITPVSLSRIRKRISDY